VPTQIEVIGGCSRLRFACSFVCRPVGICGALLLPVLLSFRSEAEESAVAVAFAFGYPAAMPLRQYHFYVYILASRSHELYIGFTNNIFRRVAEHRTAPTATYTARYNINRLVHYEHFTYVLNAIAREKKLKDWTREKKLELIQATNQTWEDLAHNW
jgi:putative endonuclease